MNENSRLTVRRTRWGSARFGSGRIPAPAVAIPAGLVLALAFGAAFVLAGVARENPALGLAVFAICSLPPWIALVYVLVVDRSTIAGATPRPDQSVEAQWYERATSGAFHDLLILLGLGAVVTSVTQWQAPVNLVLSVVLVAAAASTGVRYVVLSRRG